MQLAKLEILATDIKTYVERYKELLFWRDFPEVRSISVFTWIEMDDMGGTFVSRSINDIEFVSKDLQLTLLRRIGLWKDSDNVETFEVNTILDEIDEELFFTTHVAVCNEDTMYVRPGENIDETIGEIDRMIRSRLLTEAKGSVVYAVMEPVVDYNDEFYSTTEGKYLNGVFLSAEEARLDSETCDRGIINRYSADEVDEEEWWGDRNPDDCDNEDEKLEIWRSHNPLFLTNVEEVILQ